MNLPLYSHLKSNYSIILMQSHTEGTTAVSAEEDNRQTSLLVEVAPSAASNEV